MINRLLFILLAVLGALNAGAQSIDAFPRTTTIAPTDLLLTQTNSAGAAGQKFTRGISWSNVLENLMDFPNWSGGSSVTFGGSNRVVIATSSTAATNAFKRFYIETNLAPILSNLVAAASSGDVVELGAGRFYIGVQSIRPAVGVTLKGQGRGITFIYGDVGGTPATNPIVQLVSSNIIEDMTIIANKKGSYYQWPMGASTVWGNTAPTNVTVRRVELDGDTDCITVSHTAFTSGTLEDCYLHSGGDVFNLEAGYTPTVNGEQIGGSWTFRRTKFYSDASIIQQASWAANPIANAFQISNARAYFYDCEIIATNHKATAVLIVGGDTNRIELFNTVLSATGTNGYGYEVDDQSGFGETITDVIVHNTALVASTDINGGPITTFRPTQVGSLNASAIKFVSGLASNSFLYLKADTNIAAGTFGSGLTFSAGTLTASGGGAMVITTNANQFGASTNITIKDGALLTNTSIRTALTLPTLTASRAAVLNSTGQLTNSAAVSDVELEYLDGVTSAIQTQINGKQNGQTNSSQFGASTTLTLADRLSVTNLNSYGTGAVFFGHLTVGTNVTAQSFIGSGTGTPILKLQTMMSADNAFAITVDTNYFGLTNTFNFTNLAVGQQMRVKSVSNGNPTWEVPQLISGVLTNTTSVQADWTGAELIHITNSLIANVVIIPTNMVAGKSLRVVAQASTQTYTLSVSNAAGTVVLYPFASTNGGSAYTVTNGQTVELDLLSLNGKIHAAMGRFQ